jgi:hypothetical protein
MAYMLARFDVGDYDSWKQSFDSDPVGRQEAAKSMRLYRSVENPNEVFVALEFESVDGAKSFREKLLSSGVLDRITVETQPTVVEEADAATY